MIRFNPHLYLFEWPKIKVSVAIFPIPSQLPAGLSGNEKTCKATYSTRTYYVYSGLGILLLSF